MSTPEQEWTLWENLTAEQQQSILDAPCDMRHQPPFDFAWCETHDTTFPLGGRCKYGKGSTRTAAARATRSSTPRLRTRRKRASDDSTTTV